MCRAASAPTFLANWVRGMASRVLLEPAPGDDGNAFVDLLDADADSGFMLVVGHRGGFAGGAAGHEAVDALFDLPFDEFTVSFLIDLAVLERRHQCGESSVETSGSHNNPLSVR